MMACTLCKLVSRDNKIPLNTHADFITKRDDEEGMNGGREGGEMINSKSCFLYERPLCTRTLTDTIKSLVTC